MQVIDKNDNEKRVRIIIGNLEKGKTGVSKPIRSIVVRDADTEEVYNKIMESLKNGK